MSRLIDADALCDAMYHEAFENDVSYDERNPMARWDSGLWIRYKMFENCLKNTPTIDAADRPQGEWNPYYTKRENNDIFNCKLCGTTFIVMQGKDNMNFCPNCGARMKGADDE